VVRLGLAAVLAFAAVPKLADLRTSQQAVSNYRLFPAAINQLIGVGLPIIELALALLILAGLLTRYAAVVFGLMLVVFIAGIISAWARGLNIDCGCFPGIKADLSADVGARYVGDIARDVGFVAMTVFLAVWPRSALSLDKRFGLDPQRRAELVQAED
jgi:uncharacterized membrane protein YphA (DoxX/SURF4 family)